MDDLNFIDYSSFFNKKIKALQILPDSNDKMMTLVEYREKIISKKSIDSDNLAIPIQVHSNKVQFINNSGFFEDTDGLITDNQNIILTLQTADCLPIFLFDKVKNIKGLIHSGWKGTKDKIIVNALNIMSDYGSDLSNIIIVLGASIHKCCYEIGGDLISFFDKDSINKINNRIYLSLHNQVLIDLDSLNIPRKNIYVDSRCTFMDINLSSYRRDNKNSGRMISLLGEF